MTKVDVLCAGPCSDRSCGLLRDHVLPAGHPAHTPEEHEDGLEAYDALEVFQKPEASSERPAVTPGPAALRVLVAEKRDQHAPWALSS